MSYIWLIYSLYRSSNQSSDGDQSVDWSGHWSGDRSSDQSSDWPSDRSGNIICSSYISTCTLYISGSDLNAVLVLFLIVSFSPFVFRFGAVHMSMFA